MSYLSKAAFVQNERHGLRTIVLPEATYPGQVLERATNFVYDSSDTLGKCVFVNDLGFSTPKGTQVAAGTRGFVADVPSSNAVWVLFSESSGIVAGNKVKALPAYGKCGPATDVDKDLIGTALQAADADIGGFVDLRG